MHTHTCSFVARCSLQTVTAWIRVRPSANRRERRSVARIDGRTGSRYRRCFSLVVRARREPVNHFSLEVKRRCDGLRTDRRTRRAILLDGAYQYGFGLSAHHHLGQHRRRRETTADKGRRLLATTTTGYADCTGPVEQVYEVATCLTQKRRACSRGGRDRTVGAERHHTAGDGCRRHRLLAGTILIQIHEPTLLAGTRQYVRRAAGLVRGEVLKRRRVVKVYRSRFVGGRYGQIIEVNVETVGHRRRERIVRLQRVLAVA